ncbi:AMP-binding protein [Altererythrobacter aquiaggeris]|uniref:AMP-binding protein n=1 Tax=Aestuarierythrobacter aquiaggeris TaxID=1898396 RepID=UPI0030158C3D
MNVSSAPDHPDADVYQHPCAWDMDFPPLTLPQMLENSVRRAPAAPMIMFMGRTYSYSQIMAEARGFAAGLQAAGIERGDRIGLFLPNVPIYPAAYYGAMIAGCAVVNFSPLYSAEELAHQVEDSGTKMLVTMDVPALLPTALEVLGASSLSYLLVGRLPDMLPAIKGYALRLLGRKQLTAIPARKDVLRWAEFARGNPSPVEISADDLALLQYTGGTTGTPKGAMLTHQNLSANARQVDAIDPFTDIEDIILGVLPMFHVFANTCVLNRTILKGGCMALLPRFDAGQALKTLAKVGATAFPGVPTMYQALLDHPDFAKTDFSSLQVCISGGAPLPAPVREAFQEKSRALLVEGYGLTESSGVVSTNPYQGENRPGTIGQPLPRTRVMLLDKENPAIAAAAGEPGELVVIGPQIMGGYWNRPDAAETAFAQFNGERWLRTGDIAMIDSEGYMKIVDRSKDMIAVGGFKVFPSRIEAVLVEHEAVKEALVLGVPDDYLGEVPNAYITLNDGADTSADSLKTWLNPQVGKHERVAEIVIRNELPKTMIGKLDRKALRAEVL